MARKTTISVFEGPRGIGALSRFVQLLNTTDYVSAPSREGKPKIGGDYRPIQKELRSLAQAWFKSGRSVAKLLDANPALNQAIQRYPPQFIPTKTGPARLAFLTAPEYPAHAKPLEIAFELFRDFLLNPDNDRLGGPCKRCGNYYVRKSRRKMIVYCSRRCAHLFTSRLANKIRRDRKHKAQLQARRGVLRRYGERRKRRRRGKTGSSSKCQISRNIGLPGPSGLEKLKSRSNVLQRCIDPSFYSHASSGVKEWTSQAE